MITFTRRALFAALPALAADFWSEKSHALWDAGEVERMLTDSPWAGTAVVRPQGKALVRWASAAPVQMAIARRDQGTLSVPSAPQKMPFYAITVGGLDLRDLPKDRQARHELLIGAVTLKPANGISLTPDDAFARPSGELEFRFPKDTPITGDAPAVDFALHLGKIALRRRFLTARMTLDGNLAL